MAIFDYKDLYDVYDDNTSFFLKDIFSVKHMVDTIFRTFQD